MIFLVGNHKSGTSLLRSLLDGHPGLAVIPFETHFIEAAGIGSTYPLWRRSATDQPGNPSDHLKKIVTTSLQGENSMGGSFMPWLDESEALARATEIAIPARPSADWIKDYLSESYHVATGERKGHRQLVEKSVENAEHVAWLVSLSPDVRVVQISRDPLENVVSLRRYLMEMSTKKYFRYPRLRRVVDGVQHSSTHCLNNQRSHPSQVMTLSYEGLTGDPEHSMRTTAAFLGVDYSDELLRPTSNGQAWFGNSSTGQQKSGVVDTRSGGGSNPLERSLLDSRFATQDDSDRIPRIGAWDLARLIVPRRREGARAYLANRAALFDR